MWNTEPRNKSRVGDFPRNAKPLYPIVGGIIADKGPQPRFVHDPFPLVIISRYRDNIYICLANVPPSVSGAIAHAISILLHSIYGIRLKWEPHGDCYIWGEGSIGVQGGELSLIRKGACLDDPPLEDQEWEKWVDTSSPHAPMVWKIHFPSLLIKCVWYASNTECLKANPGGRKGRGTAKGTRKGIADRVGQGTEGEGRGTVGRLTFSSIHFTNCRLTRRILGSSYGGWGSRGTRPIGGGVH